MQKTTPSVALVETTIFESQFSGKGLFCFSSICKFDCLKNPCATITSLLNFTSDSEDLFYWYETK